MKSNISEYTEKEFLEFVKDIYTNNKKKFPTEESHIQAVLEFKKLTEHPSGSDLLYYPNENREDSPAGVVKEVKEWRASKGLPGFKAG
ncbi:TPA: bacteriocin immunity protein [Pseudomonas aeruginosa]|uniref:pyocin-S1/S2 immunity protein n=1 Tax=Pseudomonas paraeruginosa TaxID=2994495 RepID=UPI0039FD17C2|nr:bacteriocin immunity protein [Pseudomonas aeruginosa]